MAKLKIIWPDNREQEYEITKDTVVIGRTGENDLKLADNGVSRKQCKIEGSPGNYSLVDLDSKNGTMVNGVTISTSQLKHKDNIVIGHITIVFLDEESKTGDTEEKEEEKDVNVPAFQNGDRVCPSCGAVIKGGDVLCVKCGTFLKKESSGPGMMSIKDNWIAWSLLLLVISVLVIGGIILLKKDSGDTAAGSREDLNGEVLKMVRDLKTPTEGTYGDLFDRINISNSDIDIDLTRMGDNPELQMYKVVFSFVTEDGLQSMVFHVDLQSEEAKDILDDPQFTFTRFP